MAWMRALNGRFLLVSMPVALRGFRRNAPRQLEPLRPPPERLSAHGTDGSYTRRLVSSVVVA